MQITPGQRVSPIHVIRSVLLAALLATTTPVLPGVELPVEHKTEFPFEASEGERESVNFVVTRHRRVRIKSDVWWKDRETVSDCRGPLPSRPCPSRLGSLPSLPNGLPAPLVC